MKNKKRIPVFDFTLGTKEKEFVNDCLETSFISQGSYVKDFEKKMEYGWKAADFVISRAGASTIAEAIENEVPAILIPYPYATENHQQKNADFFTAEVQGGAQLMENSSLEETLFQEIKKMVEQDLILKRKKAICFYKTVPKKTLCQLVLDQLIDGGGSP